ncbi:hypothetical protein ANCCAN_27975 [Ancylostoma caninum]|uniref:Uncharacterized protein n=1 Tax=Ancylostoma caninum TaxID=29170 RepID=A0A368F5L3_ANCCA|nr:hypothetical protein ANCCAN_27975 [Ancylostoma caninum]
MFSCFPRTSACRFDALRQPRITDLFQKRAPEESNPVINEHGKRCHDGDNEQEERMDRDEDKENEPKKQRQVVEKAASAPSTSAALVKKTLARDGFDEWLKYLKKKWRILKVSSVHSRKERASTMVERMISHTRDALRDRIWQVCAPKSFIKTKLFDPVDRRDKDTRDLQHLGCFRRSHG